MFSLLFFRFTGVFLLGRLITLGCSTWVYDKRWRSVKLLKQYGTLRSLDRCCFLPLRQLHFDSFHPFGLRPLRLFLALHVDRQKLQNLLQTSSVCLFHEKKEKKKKVSDNWCNMSLKSCPVSLGRTSTITSWEVIIFCAQRSGATELGAKMRNGNGPLSPSNYNARCKAYPAFTYDSRDRLQRRVALSAQYVALEM